MLVQPYLSFEGRAEEAIEFYKKAVGAKVTMLMRFNENSGAAASRDDACRLRAEDHAFVDDDW